MTWTSISPIGTQSVRANRTTMAANTVYIETKMGNSVVGSDSVTVRDHFWNVDANLDGRHRFIQSPAFTVGAVPADPTLGTDMNSVMYTRFKTATESTFQQDVQAYLRNITPNIMQILGIRACGVINTPTNATPTQADVVYSHNLALQSAGTPGIVYTSEGFYTITFDNALPSANYLVVGGAIRASGTSTNELLFNIPGSNTLTNVKSTTTLKVMLRSDGGTGHRPLQWWFACFGG